MPGNDPIFKNAIQCLYTVTLVAGTYPDGLNWLGTKNLLFQMVKPKYFLYLCTLKSRMQLSHVSSLLQKELAIEFRQKFAVSGVFLFAAAVVFIVVKTFQNIPVREWVLLVWIILLFSGLNAVVKSFLQEKKETWHYYYTLFDPVSLLVAKLIYNLVFLCLVFVCILLCFAFFNGFPVKDPAVFASGSLLGILGLATIFTFVSVMAAADQGGATLMSILALPLTLPVLLLLIKVSFVSTALMTDTDVSSDLWMLAGIDLLLLGIALLLFPYIWKS